jgi:predicted Zn-dependent protease
MLLTDPDEPEMNRARLNHTHHRPDAGLDTDNEATTAADTAAAAASTPPNAPDPLEGLTWASKTITWSFATANIGGQPDTFAGFMTNATERALVEKAAAMWQSVSGITLVEVADSPSVDIRVGFGALSPSGGGSIGLTSYDASGSFFTPGTTVTVADPGPFSPTVLPDGDLTYSGFVSRFYQVVAHEFGHALGLAHNLVDDAALMWAVSQTTNRSIDPNDVASLQQLYGANPAGNPVLRLTDSGPANFDAGTAGTVAPFTDLTVTDGPGLQETVTVTVTGGGTLIDPATGTGAVFSNGVFTESGTNLQSVDYAQSVLNRLVYTPASPNAAASFQVVVENSLLGSASDSRITVNAPTPAGGLSVLDTTTGQAVTPAIQSYSGPVAGLTQQYVSVTSDSLNITATTPNWFIHSGSGTDAIDVSRAGGNNVLDGSTGSNFLVGGSGDDTFFLDDRAPAADVFSTVVNFHSGDTVTIFGVNATDFAVNEYDNQGAQGAQGLDLSFTAAGHPDANVVLAGYTIADLVNGTLAASYGATADQPGIPGSQYLMIHGS